MAQSGFVGGPFTKDIFDKVKNSYKIFKFKFYNVILYTCTSWNDDLSSALGYQLRCLLMDFEENGLDIFFKITSALSTLCLVYVY